LIVSKSLGMFAGKKIVVVMPAYNAAATLRKTYDEVMAQNIVDLVVLVDDRRLYFWPGCHRHGNTCK
jgi:hypothetical protein